MGDAQDGERSWIDSLADRFEREWRAGRGPRIEEYLKGVAEPGLGRLLEELLLVERELEGGRVAGPTAEEYRLRFPGHTAVVDKVFAGLVHSEIRATGRARASGPRPFSPDGESDGPEACNGDPTLTYSVAGGDGRLGPLVAAEQQRRLRAAFRPGGVLQGRYAIESELGAGGMGRVYLGKDLRLGRPVAIKVSLLLGRDDDPGEGRRHDLREAFAEEARLGANLTHPAIATVYDYGFHDDKPFTVFEYLPGETLRDLLRRRGRLPLEEVRLIIGALAQALDFAHARHVVHRDLKPENIRGTGQGPFKVLDLGLAKEFRREIDWSGFAGTPAYAAPEQAAGEPCDGRADQYALALIAYELLAGRRLFAARDADELLRLHRGVEPTWLGESLADLPASVCQALARALSKSPDRRFASCGDLAVALGCQFLNTPAPSPAVLLEANVQNMTIGRFGRHLGFGRFEADVQNMTIGRHLGFGRFNYPIHLALTRDALWSVHRAEVRRWRLREIEWVAPPITPLKALATGSHADAEEVRLTHREIEERVIHVAELHDLALFFIAYALGIIVILSLETSWKNRFWDSRWTLGLMLVGMLFGLSYVVARGLRRFQPWARGITLVGSMVTWILTVFGVMAALLLGAIRVTDVPLLSFFLVPLLALMAYPAYVLASRPSRFVFSETYRAIIGQTQRLDPLIAFSAKMGRNTLGLKLRETPGKLPSVTFRFATEAECRRWAEQIAALLEQQPAPPVEVFEDPTPGPVVLLRGRPHTRYQVLGSLEAKGDTRQIAEAGLQVRAAMTEADAVLDLQEEVLPEFHRTMRRLSGTAVRAVDAYGRFEFLSRWYADRISRVANWSITLVLTIFWIWSLCLIINIPTDSMEKSLVKDIQTIKYKDNYKLYKYRNNSNFENQQYQGSTHLARPSLALRHLAVRLIAMTLFFIVAFAWPGTLAILLRWLLWPQLLRALAVSVFTLVSIPFIPFAGMFLGALVTGRWGSLAYHFLIFSPVNLPFMLLGLFVGRSAWRAEREYRRLVLEDIRRVPWRRVLGGRLAWFATILYVLLLSGSLLLAGFGSVG